VSMELVLEILVLVILMNLSQVFYNFNFSLLRSK